MLVTSEMSATSCQRHRCVNRLKSASCQEARCAGVGEQLAALRRKTTSWIVSVRIIV